MGAKLLLSEYKRLKKKSNFKLKLCQAATHTNPSILGSFSSSCISQHIISIFEMSLYLINQVKHILAFLPLEMKLIIISTGA